MAYWIGLLEVVRLAAREGARRSVCDLHMEVLGVRMLGSGEGYLKTRRVDSGSVQVEREDGGRNGWVRLRSKGWAEEHLAQCDRRRPPLWSCDPAVVVVGGESGDEVGPVGDCPLSSSSLRCLRFANRSLSPSTLGVSTPRMTCRDFEGIELELIGWGIGPRCGWPICRWGVRRQPEVSTRVL